MPGMSIFRRTVFPLALALALPMAWPTAAIAAPRTHAAARAERTHFHFDNLPVRSALQLLAEDGGFNLVVSDAVAGTITLRLDDVTWEQALAVVLRMKGLGLRVLGDSRVVDVN